MRKLINLVPALLACLFLAACASFTTNTFRTEQTAVNLAFTSYVGWTNYLAVGNVTPQASNAVKQARLKFAATVSVLDGLRAAYETNSAIKPQIQAAIDSLNSGASNIVWLVSYYKGN